MKTPRVLIVVGLLALLALRLAAAPPRGAVSQQEGLPSFSVGVSAVALDVVVTDTRGRFVRGLTQDDFLIMEEGTPQELAFFTSEGTPVTVMVLLDSSASVRSSLIEVQNAANRFIDRLPRGDVARIGFFHNRVVFGPRIHRRYEGACGHDQPDEAAAKHPPLRRAPRLAPGAVHGSRIVRLLLVFTDGDDEGSQASMEDALEAAQRSQASVYSVGLLGWSSADGMDVNEGLLSRMSRSIRVGEPSFRPNEKEMRTGLRHRSQTSSIVNTALVYFPTNSRGRVRLAQRRSENDEAVKNLVVRTRLGYYRSPETVQ